MSRPSPATVYFSIAGRVKRAPANDLPEECSRDNDGSHGTVQEQPAHPSRFINTGFMFWSVVSYATTDTKKQPKMSTQNDRQQVQRTLGLACTHGNQNNAALSKPWTWLVGEVQVQCRIVCTHRRPAGICCTNTESN